MSTQTQPDRKLQARDALLDAAELLFTAKGYAGVGTREIAETAQVNLGAIQYYFGSKEELFVETVRRLMERNRSENGNFALAGPVSSKREAAMRLCQFILSILDYYLRPHGPHACRMMYREIFTETSPEMFEALVSSVVDDFIKPVDDVLLSIARQFRENASPLELGLFVQSIIGQCSFYVTHRPFAERLRGVDFSQPPIFTQIAQHVASFSLRALGCEESLIEQAICEVFAEPPDMKVMRGNKI